MLSKTPSHIAELQPGLECERQWLLLISQPSSLLNLPIRWSGCLVKPTSQNCNLDKSPRLLHAEQERPSCSTEAQRAGLVQRWMTNSISSHQLLCMYTRTPRQLPPSLLPKARWSTPDNLQGYRPWFCRRGVRLQALPQACWTRHPRVLGTPHGRMPCRQPGAGCSGPVLTHSASLQLTAMGRSPRRLPAPLSTRARWRPCLRTP